MHENLIVLVFISLFLLINGQNKDDDRDDSIAKYLGSRTSKDAFETQFSRGRCPQRFYQLGNECIYFANDGKSYAWKRADNICSRRIARILEEPSAGNSDQPNMQPTNGVRQLVLNTPEKTEILRALFRDYQEQNFAVRLPFDYNTLQRCQDGQDDKWPYPCSNLPVNSTCFETTAHGQADICVREVDCDKKYLRLACEFTLPGNPELTNSQFRNCPAVRGRRRLPKWAWIAIIVGSSILGLLILIIGGLHALTCICKKKKSLYTRNYPDDPRPPTKVIRMSPKQKRQDPATQPMLTRAVRTVEDDTNYLQPRSSATDNTANA